MRTTTSRPLARPGIAFAGLLALLVGAAGLVACGGSPSPTGGGYTAPPGALPGSPGLPGGSPTGTPAGRVVVTPLPITGVEVTLSTSQPVQVVAHVTGYVPNTCARPREPQVSRSGQLVTVRIDQEQPAEAVCGQVATPYQRDVPLGTFAPGDYTLQVNTVKTTFHVG